MIPIFKKNYQHGVREEELFEPLQEHKSNILGDKLEVLWNKANRKYKRFALHVALFKLVGLELILIGILKLICELAYVVVTPVAISGLVSYFESTPKVTLQEAYIYAGVLMGFILIDGIIHHQALMGVMHICMKMRVSCCSLIYRKSLRMTRTSLAQTTIGQIANLLSNDVNKFDQSFVWCHYVIIGPLQTALATYLLYRILGVAAFSGIVFLIVFIPLQILIGNKISVLRLRTAFRTDERFRLMNEILNGIQVIKMYTWEKPFAVLVAFARRQEIKSIRANFFLKAIMFSFEMFIARTSVFISLVVYVVLGATMSADVAYSVTAIYNRIRFVMTMLFSFSIASCAEVHISICRIQKFLSYDEQPSIKHDHIPEKSTNTSLDIYDCISSRTPKITMENVCAKWIENSSDNTITDLTVDIEGHTLITIIGPVGSGKSSLFNVILGELPLSKGHMRIVGKVSYASQESWLFSASVKQNILFGDVYDEDRYKTVLKVCALESDLAMLPYGDRTIVGEKGKSVSGGQKARINLARCIYKHADIYLLDDPLSAVDTQVGKQLFKQCIKGFLQEKMCLLITHQLQYLKETDKIVIFEGGRIVDEGTYEKLERSGLNFAKLLQQFNSNDELDLKDKTVTRSRQISETSELNIQDDLDDPQEHKENLITGHIKAITYLSYFKAGGNYFVMFLVAFAFIANQVVGSAGDYYVSFWVNSEQAAEESNMNTIVNRDQIIFVYSGIIIATIILAIGHSMFFFMFAMRSSVTMHDNIFRKISFAPMSFFNANPTGRILNRFSKDMAIIDDYIPIVLSDVIVTALLLIGTIVLTAMVNVWLIFPSLGLLVLFYLLRIVFLETSRTVKRIEGIRRSPILTHLTASMHGLSTIRAFSAQNTLIQEFDYHQDNHSSAWYLFISASRAFGLWLDLICNVFVACVIISLLALDKGYYGGDIGLVITQYLSLIGVLQWGMRQWSELENNMTSVERVLEFTAISLEPVRDAIKNMPDKWPEFGKIVLEDVSMKYTADDLPVLKNLNFTIYPMEKIGVVGRTGAGKTSTISALFQLYDIEGSIKIDDVDTTKLPLDLVRSKISIIPQDPVLFKGTIRKNLDPFEEYGDDVIWNALMQVELKNVISEEPAGLNMFVSESGSNFSIGQRQLVCLARAIIRNNKILIMDEATANVDPYTDSLIQKTIRKQFAQCTVLTIAHRLHTIMDSDRVLVIDAGEVVEFDHPYNLLQLKNGVFYAMVETTGVTTSRNLNSIAEECFSKRKDS